MHDLQVSICAAYYYLCLLTEDRLDWWEAQHASSSFLFNTHSDGRQFNVYTFKCNLVIAFKKPDV